MQGIQNKPVVGLKGFFTYLSWLVIVKPSKWHLNSCTKTVVCAGVSDEQLRKGEMAAKGGSSVISSCLSVIFP